MINSDKSTNKKIDILCNWCAESCIPSCKDVHEFHYDILKNDEFHVDGYGLIEIRVTGGYCSDVLEDLTEYKFSVCEKCLSKLFMLFSIKPVTREIKL